MSQDDSREIHGELGNLEHSWKNLVAYKLRMWAIRWVIGFALIGAITYFYPGLWWLWWAGLGVALVSLAVILAIALSARRRFTATRKSLIEIEADARRANDATLH